MLKPLREAIEAAYTHWFLPKLSLAWGQFVGPLLEKWRIERVPNQQDFFESSSDHGWRKRIGVEYS